jgi:hypothetical protein
MKLRHVGTKWRLQRRRRLEVFGPEGFMIGFDQYRE